MFLFDVFFSCFSFVRVYLYFSLNCQLIVEFAAHFHSHTHAHTDIDMYALNLVFFVCTATVVQLKNREKNYCLSDIFTGWLQCDDSSIFQSAFLPLSFVSFRIVSLACIRVCSVAMVFVEFLHIVGLRCICVCLTVFVECM